MNEATPPPSPVSDGSLLRRFRRGEDDAATQLYLRYADRLERLARRTSAQSLGARVDPEDVVQSVFRTFFRRAAAGQYELPASEELWRLMLVIALNKIRKLGLRHRAAKRDVTRTKNLETWEHVSRAATGTEEALSLLQMVIDELLSQLPAAHREMIELRIAGYEVAEIAARTQRAQRSVERVLQGFREQLSRATHDT